VKPLKGGVHIIKDRAIVDVALLHQMAERTQRRNWMISRLTARLDEERILLRTALHELAVAYGEEPARFIRHWENNHRDGVI